jgi:hypothetical protein
MRLTFGTLASAAACAALLAIGAVSAATGNAPWLQNNDIATALAGKTLEGRYASGKAFTERYLDDGRIEYIEGGKTIGGHWSVTAGTFCTIYDTDPAGGCFRVTRVGSNCFEFYFASRTEAAAPGPEDSVPSWTARGSVSGQASACDDGANV